MAYNIEQLRDHGDEEYESETMQQMRLEEKMAVLVGSLETLAKEQVSKKSNIEDRWLKDLRQFHGKYETDVLSKLSAANKSQIFVNYTRNKSNSWEARLSDMLFPTDDKNWGIKPTPSPELATALKDGNEQAGAVQDEATKRASAMDREIEDQLREASYNIKNRDAIHDSCVLGSGIIKGPTASAKNKRQWRQGEEGHELAEISDPRPDWSRVDPWNYFPDMNARTKDECEFEFERHLLSKKEMRKLAKQPGFDKKAIQEVLKEEARENIPDYIQQVKAIVDDGQSLEAKYVVWEYHGPLDGNDLMQLLQALGKDEEAYEMEEEFDPLAEMQVIMWFCQNKVLKIGMHPLDSEDSMYSVFNLEKDDSSVFGFGVPYLMRDSQKSLNGAWRMIMDNSALSTGPQIVVNTDIIEPMDGNWNLTARKVWKAKLRNGQGLDHAFKAYSIDGHQQELIQVINLAKQFADDETNLPLVAQGESGAHQTQTSGGMSMLMNAVNVVFRRVVKNFDDDVTIPNIRRIYDFNMQFSQKEYIKGDFEIDARGSSVLLVREVQAQNLMQMAMQFSAHPVLGPLTKTPELYRSLVQAHMLPADSIVKTDEELQQEAEAAAQNPPPPDPEMVKMESAMQIEKLRGDMAVAVAEMNRDTQMMKLAEQKNMQLEELKARLGIAKGNADSKERMFAAEVGLKQQEGEGI